MYPNFVLDMIRMPKSNDADNIFIKKTIMHYIREGWGAQSQFLKISIGFPAFINI